MTQATANHPGKYMRIPNKKSLDKATDPELKLLLNSWIGLTWGVTAIAGICLI